MDEQHASSRETKERPRQSSHASVERGQCGNERLRLRLSITVVIFV
jgi:hypothetical protein